MLSVPAWTCPLAENETPDSALHLSSSSLSSPFSGGDTRYLNRKPSAESGLAVAVLVPWALTFERLLETFGSPQRLGSQDSLSGSAPRQSCSKHRARGCLPWMLLGSTVAANIPNLCWETYGDVRQNSASLELNILLQRCRVSAREQNEQGAVARGCAWLCFLVRTGQAPRGAPPTQETVLSGIWHQTFPCILIVKTNILIVKPSYLL